MDEKELSEYCEEMKIKHIPLYMYYPADMKTYETDKVTLTQLQQNATADTREQLFNFFEHNPLHYAALRQARTEEKE